MSNVPNPPPTIAQILNLWDQGHDTNWIARYFGVHEAIIYNALHRYDCRLEATAPGWRAPMVGRADLAPTEGKQG